MHAQIHGHCVKSQRFHKFNDYHNIVLASARIFRYVQGSGSSSACNILEYSSHSYGAHGSWYFVFYSVRTTHMGSKTFILNDYMRVLCARDDAKPFHNCVNNIGDSTQLTHSQRTDAGSVALHILRATRVHYVECRGRDAQSLFVVFLCVDVNA